MSEYDPSKDIQNDRYIMKHTEIFLAKILEQLRLMTGTPSGTFPEQPAIPQAPLFDFPAATIVDYDPKKPVILPV